MEEILTGVPSKGGIYRPILPVFLFIAVCIVCGPHPYLHHTGDCKICKIGSKATIGADKEPPRLPLEEGREPTPSLRTWCLTSKLIGD